jgi:glycogen debranching enzyme
MPTGDFDTSKTASDKRPVNLGLSGFIDSDLTNKLLQADTHKDAGVTDIAKNAAQAMLHSAIQSPMEAVVQIGAAATGQKFEAPTLISAPKPAEFGTSEWCAQTVGSGIGMVAPFLASEAIVGKLGKGLSKLGGAELAASIESTEMGAKLMPLARPIGHSVVSGAMYGLVFTPSRDSDDNFLGDRFKHAAVGGITFGAQRAATLGITAATEHAMTGSFELARQRATNLGSMARIGGVEATLNSPLLSTAGRIGANALGGGIAGTVNANAQSLIFDGRTATRDEMVQSAAAFVVTGGALDAAHLAGGKATEAWRGRGQNNEAPVVETAKTKLPSDAPEKSSGGSGGLADVHARLTEGAESAREGTSKPNSEMVQQAHNELTGNIKRLLNLAPNHDLSNYPATRDLDTLLNKVTAREHDIEGANGNEVTRTLRAVNSILTADKLAVNLSPIERVALAKQILFEASTPKDMPTGLGPAAPILAMEQSISYWNPGRYAESVASLVTTGKYKSPGNDPVDIDLSSPQHRAALEPNSMSRFSLANAMKPDYQPDTLPTYAGQLNTVLGVNLITQTNPAGKSVWMPGEPLPNVEPAQLMRIFDLKTGVYKPELTLKKPIGSHFGIVDRTGNMKIIANDTVWAELGTQVNGQALNLTGKSNSNYFGAMDLTNRGDVTVAADGIKLSQQLLPTEHGFSKLVRVENTLDYSVSLSVAEQFKPRVEDIFPGERGWVEPEPLPAKNQGAIATPESVTLTYTQQPKPPQYILADGRDVNTYQLQFSASKARDLNGAAEVAPQVLPKGATYQLTLAPGQAHEYQVDVRTSVNKPVSEFGDIVPFTEAKAVAKEAFDNWIKSGTQVRFDSADGTAVFNRSMADIATLMIPTEHGAILAAGVPDFVTIFGRDSKTASEQILAYNPEVAKANLRADADLQGQIYDDYSAQQPGKMVHEVREGPLAKTLVQQSDGSYRSALPFSKYYGSVDSTPMFLKLFGRYVDQTGDMNLVEELYPQIQKSLDLMDAEVKRGGGFLRYGGGGNEALSNQGWKDSGISIKDSKDNLSKAPIALAEPQGYLYEGWMQIAKIERLLATRDSENFGQHMAKAAELTAKAKILQQKFEQDFWMSDKQYVALALDGNGKQADVVTSNPGHLLATGILSPERAQIVARRMTEEDMSSGFGTRTMASSEQPYFANSYHNGPIWLHDFWYWANGAHDFIPQDTARITTEALDAVEHFPDKRVPELWGGYPRNEYDVPIPYPRANSPQAWSGGAVLGLLSANLGLRPQAWANGFEGSLHISKPIIPEGFGNQVELTNYRVGDKVVSLRFTKNAQGGADVEVLSNPQGLNIDVTPFKP